MNKKIVWILCVILFNNYAIADSQSYGPIIQRQSKQIQDLKSRVVELENIVEDLKIAMKNNGMLKKSAGASVKTLSAVVGEEAAEAVLMPNAKNSFFGEKAAKKVASPPVSRGPKDKVAYDSALAALKEGRFDSAEQQFHDFIQKYPSSRLQSNATFWYGETFYRRGAFSKAAINYLQSYKKYPKGSKASDSLLKLAYSLASLNKHKEACSMLEKLELEFPKRPITSIKRAKEARAKFHCK